MHRILSLLVCSSVFLATTAHALPPGTSPVAKGDVVCLDGNAPIPGIGCPPEDQPSGTTGRTAPPPASGSSGQGVCAPQVPYFPNLNDTCRWAPDGECDEPRYGGTGACQDGTDTTDCRGRGGIGPDSCPWSYNGQCNEARYGCNGACPAGTDTADCSGVRTPAWPAPASPPSAGNNACRWAHDGECDDPTVPGHVTTACAPGTDAADCARPGPAGGNSCAWAYDGECDDPSVPGHLTTACPPGTDNHDCGR